MIGTKFSVSFYVPAERKGRIIDGAFLYSSGTNSAKRTRPFGMILVDSESGNLLAFQEGLLPVFYERILTEKM